MAPSTTTIIHTRLNDCLNSKMIFYADLHFSPLMLVYLPMKTLSYIQIILSVILVSAILLQRTGAQVGGAFGGSDNFSSAYHTRRGFEKGLFIITIVVAILFAISALINLI